MGAISGSAGYLRFFVDGEAPNDLGARFEQAIEARRFLPIAPDGTDGIGWVPMDAPFDDELPITRDRFHFSHLIALGYREDTYSVGKRQLEHLVDRRVIEVEKEGKKVGRALRRAIRDALTIELRKKSLPRTRVVDMIWDLDRAELRVFGRGTIATERCIACFERTFSVRTRQATWPAHAFEADLSERARAILERLEPAT